MIDPTFKNLNRLFILSFKNGNNDSARDSFDKYYMSLIEIKDFKCIKWQKTIFWSIRKKRKKQEAYEKRVEMLRNDDYTTGNLLNILYH